MPSYVKTQKFLKPFRVVENDVAVNAHYLRISPINRLHFFHAFIITHFFQFFETNDGFIVFRRPKAGST